MRLDKSMQPGEVDAAHCLIERDREYGTAEMMVLAVV